MRALLKRVISFFLVPLTRWYLRKERKYNYKGTLVIVHPAVFHPGFFSSTQFLLQYLERKTMQGTQLLELGCGTGLIALLSAKAGAQVVASDLSVKAIENAKQNFSNHQVDVSLIHSDLFDDIPQKKYDWIIINPPYYAKTVRQEEDLAWHCGQDFQYFQKLFQSLLRYIDIETQIIMVLTLGCDLDKIFMIAEANKFKFELLKEKNVLFDGKDYLYQIRFKGFA